jgi:hypothetical protein
MVIVNLTASDHPDCVRDILLRYRLCTGNLLTPWVFLGKKDYLL